MAETHELRLKVNASAARAGAAEFRGALKTIQKAVQELDRTSDGAFTSLRTGAKDAATATASATDRVATSSKTAGDRIKQIAIQSQNALRVSTDQASRLRDRLLSVGDTAGLDRLNAGLDQLKNSLTSATTGLDVRSARAGYADLASELNRTAREAERLRAESIAAARAETEAAAAAQQHAASLEALRAKYNPLYSASKQYEKALEEIALAEREGALSASVAAQARERAASSLLSAGSAADVYSAKARVSGFQTANLAAQFNDIGVMLAAGQSPLMLAVQQGTQISQVLTTMGTKASVLATLRAGFMAFLSPVTLATVGIIAGGAALVQWGLSAIGATEDAKTFATQQEALSKLSTEVGGTLDILQMNLVQLTDKYGAAAIEVRNLAIAQAELRRGDLRDILREQIDQLGFIATRYEQAYGAAGLYSNGLTNIAADFDITRAKAKQLEPALMSLAKAPGWEEQKAALQALITRANDLGVSLSKFPPEVRAAANAMIDFNSENAEAERLLQQAQDALTGATGQTNAWASAMSGVRAEIDAIMSSLSNLSGGVISNAAKGAELTALRAGKTVKEAEIARRRYQAEAEFKAREAGSGTGITGVINRGLIGAERYQFEEGLRLDAELDKARAAARKAASSGGGSSRVQTLGDETGQLQKLIKEMNRRVYALDTENEALALVANGQAANIDVAKLMIAAQREGAGAIDAQTQSMIAQYAAAQALNNQLQRLARDPVKEWIKSVPTWQEAGQQIETEVLGSLSDAIANFAQTGKFDFESLGASILATATKVMAQKAVLELVGLLGGNTDTAGGGAGGFGLGGLIASFFAKEGGLTSAPANVNAGPMVSPTAFRNAPHYAQGTANTSGIPAMLHDNEAVIPLSGNRKVPVELNNGGANGFTYAPNFNWNVQTPDADSFRRSQKQTLAEAGVASRKAMRDIR